MYYPFVSKIKIILPVCCMVAVLSCSKKLDLTPETTLTDAAYWKTPKDLLDACNTLYSSMPVMAGGYQDNYSDISFAAKANSISDGSRLTPATASEWSGNYTLIRRANTILEKAPGVTGDSASIQKAKGEAFFYRALGYFELLKRFGDIPLILRTFDITDTLVNAHRTPRANVIASIYADLDKAAGYLPSASVQPAAEYGRITSGAALAFKSRVALFEGTREKFFSYGDSKADLSIAVEVSKKLIHSDLYDLYTYAAKPDSSYFYLFQVGADGRANKENILVRLYGQNMTNSISYTNVSRDLEQVAMSPTRELMDLYLYKDGLPLGKSSYEAPQENTRSEFQNRDPRLGMTVFNQGLWYLNAYYIPDFNYTITGYKTAKWFNATDWNNKQAFTDFAAIRYAEVLLNYAEATYELNGSISDEDLDLTINRLRARAGLSVKLSNAFVRQNDLSMRSEIRRERTVELAFEGMRYWDLLRWKTAEIQLPKAVLGIHYFPDEMPLDNKPALDPDGYIIAEAKAKRAFDPQKDYLWPIPTTELGYDENMTQNPEW